MGRRASLPGFREVEYPDWQALLRRLSQDARAAGWKGPLVLDEFPYLVASSPSLPSIVQNWVDREASAGGLLVAIAGSSQRMMQGMLLEAAALPAGKCGRGDGRVWSPKPGNLCAASRFRVWRGLSRRCDGELETLADEMLGRTLPPDLPRKVVRAIFVSRSTSGRAMTSQGVRVVEADAVLESLL